MQTMTWTEALEAVVADPAGDPAGRERAAEMLAAIESGELRGVTVAA
ncbi:hypothetical protein [Mycolicibacterium llatzerense]|nr:hypothetical protein [Mycolicibacterium llatzerense]